MISILKYKILIPVLFITGFCTGQDTLPNLVKKVPGFSHPESVVFDQQQNLIFVSNMSNKEPGDGFISKVEIDGEISELEWVTGLDDPKGLLISDDTLYVADNTALFVINIETGEIIKKIPAEGAQFLNDVAADNAGNIYISDTRKNSIFSLQKNSGEITEWLNSEELENPNGLLVVDNNIYIGAWGGEEMGNFLKAELDSKEITKISNSGVGRLDGIQRSKDGGFYVSDWATGDVVKIDSLGNSEKILTADKSSGDILYLEKQNTIVLPMNLQNEVWWYPIE